MILYGIKNCNSVKKAINYLKGKNIPFDFHDYKKSGISDNKLKDWSNQIGWEILLNKKGTTWKKLEDSQKDAVNDERSAIKLMVNHSSLIKRPIIESEGLVITVGFNEDEYGDIF